MRLIIEKGTPEGAAKVETIRWAEEQINFVLTRVFDKHRLLSSLQINFQIPENPQSQEAIVIGVTEKEPESEEAFKGAIEEVKLDFIKRGIVKGEQNGSRQV
jgi:hypothetical protein